VAKLEEYKRKRRFDRTPEPSGAPELVADKVQDQPSSAAKPVAAGKPATAGKSTRLPKPKTAAVGSPSRGRAWRHVRGSEAPGDAAALRFPVGDQWDAEVLGRA